MHVDDIYNFTLTCVEKYTVKVIFRLGENDSAKITAWYSLSAQRRYNGYINFLNELLMAVDYLIT